jgi:hypothetical protein
VVPLQRLKARWKDFMPPDPVRRFGVLPTRLVAQTEDVIVDARGYAYVSDKNQGLYIVRATFP